MMRTLRAISRALVVALLVAGLAVAGWGCDDEEDEQLKIGYLADFSAALAEFGPGIQTGVELAIEQINEAGGVNGQDVLLVTGDTGLDATKAVEEARRLIEVEGVHAIVGPLASGITAAVAESVAIAAGVPVITPSGTSPSLTGIDDDGLLLRSTISDAAQGVVLAQLADDEGLDSVGVLYLNNPYGQGLADVFEMNFSGRVTSAAIEEGKPSYLAELQLVSGASHLVAIAYPAEATVFVREAIENDVFDQFLWVDGTKSQDLLDAIGADLLDGTKGTAPTADENSDTLGAWKAAYEARYGALPSLPFVAEAYDATIAIALAAEYAGSLEGADIAEALLVIGNPGGTRVIPSPDSLAAGLEAAADGEDINYDGAATTLDWDSAGDVTSGFVGIWSFQGGAIVELETVPFKIE